MMLLYCDRRTSRNMESPRKFNDCYFYYYSTCTKGDSCVFRHEPSALGCETMCVQWQQGKCLDKHCKLRHMELRKNRKQIPCYWESQPGGCRKKHCPFQHKNPEARTDGILPSQPLPPTNKTAAAAGSVAGDAEPVLAAAPAPAPAPGPAPLPPPPPQLAAHVPHPANAASMVMPHHEMMWQQQRGPVVLDSAILGVLPPADMLGRRAPPHDAPQPQYAALPVDPLVVSFEEESDNESAPSSTPTKMVCPEDGPAGSRGKSQEMLLLEQIQAAAAAYYSYEPAPAPAAPAHYEQRSLDELTGRPCARTSLDFKILSLDEIRARKRLSDPAQIHLDVTKAGRKRKLSSHDTILVPNKVLKVVRNNSVVYKKLNGNTTPGTDANNIPDDADGSRRRTFSVQSDDDELDDSLKAISTNLPPSKIKQTDIIEKPKEIKLKLIHTHSESEINSYDIHLSDDGLDIAECGSSSDMCVVDDDEIKSVVDLDIETTTEDKVNETIVLSDEDSKIEIDDIDEVTIIDSSIRVGITNEKQSNNESKENNLKKYYEEGVEEIVINVEREDSSNDSITPEIEKSLKTVIVPDVVASCHSNTFDTRVAQNEDEDKVLSEINCILNEKSL